MAIRQHEEQPKRKRDDDKREPMVLPEDVYDQAAIAVPALIEFLRGFLKTIDQPTPTSAPAASTEETPHPLDMSAPASIVPTTNPNAARAASAYQHTAQAQTSGQILQSGGGSAAQSLLQTTEVRQIHALITKLNTLENRGITAIKLEKAASFLQALDIAADHALAMS